MNIALLSARRLAYAAALAVFSALCAHALPANAQDAPPYNPPPPQYNPPPPSYAQPVYVPNGYRELFGTVADFKPYRLLLTGGGRSSQVDLDNHTVIQPLGTTLTPGMRVLVTGYWSYGVFIARSIVLR